MILLSLPSWPGFLQHDYPVLYNHDCCREYKLTRYLTVQQSFSIKIDSLDLDNHWYIYLKKHSLLLLPLRRNRIFVPFLGPNFECIWEMMVLQIQWEINSKVLHCALQSNLNLIYVVFFQKNRAGGGSRNDTGYKVHW